MQTAMQNKQELENRISDLESSLADLRNKLQTIEEARQHEAIDNLEMYLEQIDHKYTNLKDFWAIVAAELQGLLKKSVSNHSAE